MASLPTLLDGSSFPESGLETLWTQRSAAYVSRHGFLQRRILPPGFIPRVPAAAFPVMTRHMVRLGGDARGCICSLRGGGRDRRGVEEDALMDTIKAMSLELREERQDDLKGLRLDLKLRGKLAALRKEDRIPRTSALDRSALPLGSTFASIDELDEMEANYIAQILRVFKEVSPDFSRAGRASRIFFNPPADAGPDGWEDWMVCNATLDGVEGAAGQFVVLMHARLQTVVWLQHISTGSFFFAPAREKNAHMCYRWGDVEDLGSSDFVLGSELVENLRKEADTGAPAPDVDAVEVGSEVEFGCWHLSVQPLAPRLETDVCGGEQPSGRIRVRNTGLDNEWRPGVELHLREHGFVFVTTAGAAVVVDGGAPPYRIHQYDLERQRLARKLGFEPKAQKPAAQRGDEQSAVGDEGDGTMDDPADTSSLLGTVSGTEAHSAVEDTSSMSWCPSSAGMAGYNVTEIQNGNFPPIAQDWIPDEWWSD